MRNFSTWAYIDQNLYKWNVYTKLGRFLPRSDEVSMFEADKNGQIRIFKFNFHLHNYLFCPDLRPFLLTCVNNINIWTPLSRKNESKFDLLHTSRVQKTSNFPDLVTFAETILFWTFKTLKISYSFCTKFFLMKWKLRYFPH